MNRQPKIENDEESTAESEIKRSNAKLAKLRDLAFALSTHAQAVRAELAAPEDDVRVQEIIENAAEVISFVDGKLGEPTDESRAAAGTNQVGQLVRLRREKAGLSRAKLAKKARVSEASIKLLETKAPPSRKMLLRLTNVPELNLKWDEIEPLCSQIDVALVRGALQPTPRERPDGDPGEGSHHLNWHVPVTYDSMQMVRDLAGFLRGAGGYVEQTGAYLDHHSALSYVSFAQQHSTMTSWKVNFPCTDAVQVLRRHSTIDRYAVVALGAGDGTLEIRFAQSLALAMAQPDIELCLFDISQPLLNTAYRNAIDTLGGMRGVHIWGLCGNFHHLSSYERFQYQPPNHPRHSVYLALGGTFGNLDNERRFVRDNLSTVARSGDFFLLDLNLAMGGTEEEIAEKDPVFRAGVPPHVTAWLSGPVRRTCPNVTDVEFHWQLDTCSVVPDSYSLNAIATVKEPGKHDRQFSMFRFKRYDVDRLVEMFAECEWDLVERFEIPHSPTTCALLFRRR
ncbi:MAG: L-histidine N(alpha)-methyltransferase [Polyangia bacterium]